MSDAPDKHEKIHDPTPKRIRKAREEGNVFRSKEIVSVGMLLIGLSVMMGGTPFAFQALQGMAVSLFQGATAAELTVLSVPAIFAKIWMQLLVIAVPFSVVLIVAALGLNIMQSGWNVSFKALEPKGNRISPVQGLKRMFSAKGLFDFAKSLVKILIVGPIAYTTISGKLPQMRIWMQLLVIAVPFSVVLIVAALGLNIMQSGWNVSFKALEPKGNRISPVQGLKRMFSAKGLFDFAKSLVKILIVGPIAYTTISGKLPQILMLHRLPLEGILSTAGMWIMILLAQLVLVLLLLSGIDFAFEKYKYKKDLMMTTKEIKDEAKESEGDPQLKGKRRQMARSLAQRPRLVDAVLQADVVVTNPTHYAIALSYNPDESVAPRVLVKGIRKRALRIKRLATEGDIPTIEDRPLARALYDAVPEEHEIPEELYPAVAAILAEVYRRRERG